MNIRDGKAVFNTKSVKPNKGEAFGIIEYIIKNKGGNNESIEFKDFNLIVNGIRKEFVGDMEIEHKPVYGSTGCEIKGGESRMEKIIFISSEKDFKEITLQYGSLAPMKIDFKVKNKGKK